MHDEAGNLHDEKLENRPAADVENLLDADIETVAAGLNKPQRDQAAQNQAGQLRSGGMQSRLVLLRPNS
jgi:hypothetical protein